MNAFPIDVRDYSEYKYVGSLVRDIAGKDGGGTLHTALSKCPRCSAIVVQPDEHESWHESGMLWDQRTGSAIGAIEEILLAPALKRAPSHRVGAVCLFVLAWIVTVPFMVAVTINNNLIPNDPYGDSTMGLLLLTWLHAGFLIAAGCWLWKSPMNRARRLADPQETR